jgi:hypothetical protein
MIHTHTLYMWEVQYFILYQEEGTVRKYPYKFLVESFCYCSFVAISYQVNDSFA